MNTALSCLAVLCAVMAVLTRKWPHRFAIIAPGWRENKALSFYTWLMLGFFFFSLAGLRDMHAAHGWYWFTAGLAVLAVVNLCAIVWLLWGMRKPLYVSKADELVHHYSLQKDELSPGQKVLAMVDIYDAMLADMDSAERFLREKRPEGCESELKNIENLRKSLLEARRELLQPLEAASSTPDQPPTKE